MDNFLHRLKIHLIGEVGLIVYGIASLIGTLLLFAVSPVLGVLFFAVITFVGWEIHEMDQGTGCLLHGHSGQGSLPQMPEDCIQRRRERSWSGTERIESRHVLTSLS